MSIGPMLTGDNLRACSSSLQQAVALRDSAGDSAENFLEYAVMDSSTAAGCAYHPSLTTQADMASALVDHIHDVARW